MNLCTISTLNTWLTWNLLYLESSVPGVSYVESPSSDIDPTHTDSPTNVDEKDYTIWYFCRSMQYVIEIPPSFHGLSTACCHLTPKPADSCCFSVPNVVTCNCPTVTIAEKWEQILIVGGYECGYMGLKVVSKHGVRGSIYQTSMAIEACTNVWQSSRADRLTACTHKRWVPSLAIVDWNRR